VRRTKIVASIGPASWDEPVLRKVIAAGADVIRINLSHCEPATQLALVDRVRRVSAEEGRTVGVLVDLPGPKLRMAPFPDAGIELAPGDRVELRCGAPVSDRRVIGVDLDHLGLAVGDRVMGGDGAVVLEVVETGGAAGSTGDGESRAANRTGAGESRAANRTGAGESRPANRTGAGESRAANRTGDGADDDGIDQPDTGGRSAQALVRRGGRLQGRPGIHMPDRAGGISGPTERDIELALAAQAAGADAVAASFVQRAADVQRLIDALGEDRPQIVAKIETASAVDEADEILAITDAVMVARGDLGIRLPIEDVPHVQKRLVRAAIAAPSRSSRPRRCSNR
jgi:pyruvate kinase